MSFTQHDPADPQTWLARGRVEHHAQALADAWRDFPDLPFDAPVEEKQARCRSRAAALKPIHDAISAEAERQRRDRNFAHLEASAATGKMSDRDVAILRARDDHGYDWDEAYHFADGWYAAHAGWERRTPGPDSPPQLF